jgi:hypothetical protein
MAAISASYRMQEKPRGEKRDGAKDGGGKGCRAHPGKISRKQPVVKNRRPKPAPKEAAEKVNVRRPAPKETLIKYHRKP